MVSNLLTIGCLFVLKRGDYMETEIIVAVLALAGTLAGSYFSNNKNTAVMDEKIKDIKEDIVTLSNRVDKHNQLAERMIIVEQKIKNLEDR